MDKKEIENKFIKTFIKKERRERSLHELNSPKKRRMFIDRFNHTWEKMIDEKNVTPILKTKYEEIFAFVNSNLKTRDEGEVYVISSTEEDGRIMKFEEAFERLFGNGFAALLISIDSKKFYLETEQVQGAPDRFFGKNKHATTPAKTQL